MAIAFINFHKIFLYLKFKKSFPFNKLKPQMFRYQVESEDHDDNNESGHDPKMAERNFHQ